MDQVKETTVINKEKETVIDMRWYSVAYLDVVCFLWYNAALFLSLKKAHCKTERP